MNIYIYGEIVGALLQYSYLFIIIWQVNIYLINC